MDNPLTEYAECRCCHSRLQVVFEYEQPPGVYRPTGLEAVDAEDIRSQLRRLIKERDQAITAAGINQPWPFLDAVMRLVDFATQQLQRGYDGHGYEELAQARDAALAALAPLPVGESSDG